VAKMTCNCVHVCTNEAEGTGQYPTLCDVCGLSVALNSSKCGLPYVAPVWPKLEPEVPVTDEQKDQAISAAVSELGL
jgi:hypothetical protein